MKSRESEQDNVGRNAIWQDTDQHCRPRVWSTFSAPRLYLLADQSAPLHLYHPEMLCCNRSKRNRPQKRDEWERREKSAEASHGHLGLQLPEFDFLVILFHLDLLAFDYNIRVSKLLKPRHCRSSWGFRLLLGPCATDGSLSATGTVPVLSICSSSCSCCMASSSFSRSSSSMGSPIWLLVMALTISSLRAFCSRSLSLKFGQSAHMP